ncbi:MAG: hypothetical protein V4635_17680 [Bacteroidota bacterium]
MRTLAFKHLFLFTCLICIVTGISAQGVGQHKSKFIRGLQKTTWIAGISGTVIDDDAQPFKYLFQVTDSWNFLYYPSKINFEGYLVNSLSLEGALTYSQLQKGKRTGITPRPQDVTLVAFDLDLKFHPRELITNERSMSPYVITGLGYTYRAFKERKNAITYNVGFGMDVWFSKGWGLNIQTLAKFGLNNPTSRNYLQHSLGVLYRFNLLTGNKTSIQRGYRHNLFRNDS